VLRVLETQGSTFDSKTDGETNTIKFGTTIFATIAAVLFAYVTDIRITAFNQLGGLRVCVTSAQTDVYDKFPSTQINNYMALNIL